MTNRDLIAMVVVPLLVLGGCTTTSVRDESPRGENPRSTVQKNYATAIIGTVSGTDKLWDSYVSEMRRALGKELNQTKLFKDVLDTPPAAVPADAIIVNVQITDVHKGSAAARWVIGFGAGRAYITADLQLTDAAGNRLDAFTDRKAYAGGIGFGGAGFIDMDDLSTQLGTEAADSIGRWATAKKNGTTTIADTHH